MKRLPHKEAHPTCPYGTWSACDAAWAVTKAGLVTEAKEKEAARAQVRRAELVSRIDAYIERRRLNPSIWS